MKQPHKSWDCSAEGNGCIGRVRHEEGLEHFTVQNHFAVRPGEPQNVVIYGFLCSTRPLINWEHMN